MASCREAVSAVIFVLASVAVGCAYNPGGEKWFELDQKPILLPRASFDLSCPQAKVQLIQVAPKLAGASGCGRRATYRYIPNLGLDHRWVMESGPGK